jgi:hypothetical protein
LDWFEVYNNSGYDITLDNWTVLLCHEASTGSSSASMSESDCDSEVTLTLNGDATSTRMTLLAGDYAVFCAASSNFATTSDCTDRWTDYDSPSYTASTDMEPAMGGIRIELNDSAMTDPLVDQVYWWTDSSGTDDWPLSSFGSSSLQLDSDDLAATSPDPADTNDDYTTDPTGPTGNDIWCESTVSTGSDYSSPGTEYGTPGAANHTCP